MAQCEALSAFLLQNLLIQSSWFYLLTVPVLEETIPCVIAELGNPESSLMSLTLYLSLCFAGSNLILEEV